MPVSYKRSITTKKAEAKAYPRKGFITPSVPFAERWFIDMAVIKLTKDNFDQEVMQSDKPVLVDFYADWCGPCKMMGPVVEEISNEEDGVKVCKINIDEEIELAQRFGVMSIPTFIAVKGGEIAGKQIGAVPKSTLLGLVK